MTFEKLVTTRLGKPVSEASDAELFNALTQIVHEKAQKLPHASGDKKVYSHL